MEDKEILIIETNKMSDEDYHLIYVHDVGEDYNDNTILELIFSDENYKNAGGINWHLECAYGGVQPPKKEFIKKVLKVIVKQPMQFSLLTESDEFCYLDGANNIIPLAWQFFKDYKQKTNIEEVLMFRFGETLDEIKKKCYNYGLDYTI